MRIKRQGLFNSNAPAEADEDSQAATQNENPKKAARVKHAFSIVIGYRQQAPVKEAWFVPNTRKTVVVCQLPREIGGEWVAVHLSTSYILFSAPSKAFVLKLMGLILPRCNLAKWTRNFWDDARDAMGETIHQYLQHIWRADYTINEIPTVKQWLQSGLKNSHRKWTRSRGKMMVKRKR